MPEYPPTTHWHSVPEESAFCAQWTNSGQTLVSRCAIPTRQKSPQKISTDLLPTTNPPTRLAHHAAKERRSTAHWYQQQLSNKPPARQINSHPPTMQPASLLSTLRQRHIQRFRASSCANDPHRKRASPRNPEHSPSPPPPGRDASPAPARAVPYRETHRNGSLLRLLYRFAWHTSFIHQ